MTQQDDLKRLIAENERRLQQLKLQKARYGYSADPSITLEIEDIAAALQEARAELQRVITTPPHSPAKPPFRTPMQSQSADLTSSILRILDTDGNTVGTGFVIANGLAVTCAHVVQSTGSGPGNALNIEFYADQSRQTVPVQKQGYMPPDADDVAFIQLANLPADVQPVRLGQVGHWNSGHRYHAFGFARLYEYGERHVTGETIAGLVRHPRKQPMLQLNGELIKQGLSGAPVLDVETGEVVGMVSEFADDRDDGGHAAARLSWATTANTLTFLQPDLYLAPQQQVESIVAPSTVTYYSCFISYAHQDEPFAEQLYDDLQQAGVRCWYAPESLRIGDKIRVEIDKSIKSHDKLLLILSQTSIESAWVETEVEAAFEQETKRNDIILFPIRLDETVMGTDQAWAAHIRRTRHIGDFSRWQEPEAYQRALRRLLRDLRPD